MKVGRSWFFFLVMLVLCACCILLLAEKPITGAIQTLQGESEDCLWQAVGVSGGKIAAAAGWKDDTLVLRFFTTEGARLSEKTVTLPEEMTGGEISRLLPVEDGAAYVGLYGPNGNALYLYRIGGSGEPERLLARDCVGNSFQERSTRTMLSELTYEDGVLSFALREDRSLSLYRCRDTGGLEPAGTEKCGKNNVLSVFSGANGTLLVGGTESLYRKGGTGSSTTEGRSEDALVAGQSVTHLTQGRGGWYYIDAVRLDVCFIDAAFGASQRMLSLNTTWDGLARNMTSVALLKDESVLMLLDGSILTYTNGEGSRELRGILGETLSKAWFTLIGYGVLAIAAAALLWLLLCALRQGYAPLVLFRGSILVAVALLCFTEFHFIYLKPVLQTSALRENEDLVSGILGAADAGNRMQDESLVSDLGRMLEGAGVKYGRNIRVVPAERIDGAWRTPDGRLAETEDGFSARLVSAAEAVGSAMELRGHTLRYAFLSGDDSLSILMEEPYEPDKALLQRPLLLSYAAMICLALLILLTIGTDLRRISKNMESLAKGRVPERLELNTGDELESMASAVNSLGTSLKEQAKAREELEHSYRRFVPEKVLSLLGKQSIGEVDKSTFAAQRMAVMTVWFSFPETLYTDMNNSRLLFDSVNEVIERTASIVARKGGTVFHFAYNGFDVVMDDGGEAVSTAVAIQQEVLSFNELRAQERLPAVTLRIALDKGNVMLGIVGDTSQMEPTTISSSLSTVQELIDLCNRLKAGILCTEAIISERQDYGNRYMGKCVVGDQPVRVYEVFDGDEFSVRRGKASCMGDFSRGVYDLYSGDAAGAKHSFLKLAHDYPMDGGVRYYLYLADRLEHDPSLPCVLNVDNAGGGEM